MEEQFDYRTDILFQPEALQRVIDLYDPRVLEKVQERFANGSLGPRCDYGHGNLLLWELSGGYASYRSWHPCVLDGRQRIGYQL